MNHDTFTTCMSRHAESRIRQRGIAPGAIDILRQFGETVDDGFILTDQAIDEGRRALRAQIEQLEKLRGIALIEVGGTVITVYRASKKRVRRLRAGNIKI